MNKKELSELKGQVITLTDKQFNHWVAILNTAMSPQYRSVFTDTQRGFFEAFRDELYNYGKFDLQKREARLHPTLKQLCLLQETLLKISIKNVIGSEYPYFDEAASDPDSQMLVLNLDESFEEAWDSLFAQFPRLPGRSYLKRWKEWGFDAAVITFTLTFTEGDPVSGRFGRETYDWPRMEEKMQELKEQGLFTLENVCDFFEKNNSEN